MDGSTAQFDTPADAAISAEHAPALRAERPRLFGERFARVPGVPQPAIRKRILLLGGCLTDSLSVDLRADFDCRLLWRRPTIALMSPPVTPVGALDRDNRHTRYILRDCAKVHLEELRSAAYDVMIFEIVRDARVTLARCGDTYLLHPNAMLGLVPDAPEPHERTIDLPAFLGRAEVSSLDHTDAAFLDVWKAHFRAFHVAILKPALAAGKIVILQKAYLTRETTPPSEDLRQDYAHIASVNAVLKDMYAFVDTFDGIRQVDVDDAFCRTGRDARWNGIGPTHFTTDVFALMADQIRSMIDPEDPRIGLSLFSNLHDHVTRYNALRTKYDLDLHALTLETLELRQKLAYQIALRDWERRHRENKRLSNRIRRLTATILAMVIQSRPAPHSADRPAPPATSA